MTAHVLVVEDSPLITGALRLLLESAGYEVTVAATAADAIAAGTDRRADVLLLDLGLPDADGLSVVGALARSGMQAGTTFAMTGSADDATRERCLAAGCSDVLVKPVPIKQLLGIVSTAVA